MRKDEKELKDIKDVTLSSSRMSASTIDGGRNGSNLV
jgi:hypothetical protein